MTGPSEIPISLRSLVWEVLYPLTQDPEPTPEYEETYDGSNMDPATLSINTIRGAAMHAVIVYALWIKRYLKTDKIPEVIGVLDLHLDPNVDPSLAIRTVYGHYYPQLLVHLDRQWAETAIPRIFPEEAGMQDLRDSAWVTYITFNDPYHEVFSILKDEYIKAIKRLNTALEFKDHFKDPGVRLA
jgi:hypothetical protein